MTKRKFFIMAASATQQFDSKSMPIAQAVQTEHQWQRVGLATQVCERRRNGTIRTLDQNEILDEFAKDTRQDIRRKERQAEQRKIDAATVFAPESPLTTI